MAGILIVYMLSNCNFQWEEQHEGLTCEEFSQWKIDNDPEKQAKGVKLYLEENGIGMYPVPS